MSTASLCNHRFGVNYVPSRHWWYCWLDWSEDHIAADLDAIAGLGADHIRVMLLWPFFQSNPSWVSPVALDRLDRLMVLARERSLDVCPTLVNGWLTGMRFLPPFSPRVDAEFYTSPAIREALAVYFEAVAARLRAHPNLLAVDIGNEINCCWQTHGTTVGGDEWSRWCIQTLGGLLPGALIVHGADHNPWFQNTTFSPGCLAALSPVLTLHTWTRFTGALERGTQLDPPAIRLPARMAALARAHAADPAKPVWVQEYGSSDEWADPATIPDYLERTTLDAIAGGVAWFTWWASHDIDSKFDVAPMEYSMGLLTLENRPKPSALRFRELAAAHRGKSVVIPSGPAAPPPPEQSYEAVWSWLLEH